MIFYEPKNKKNKKKGNYDKEDLPRGIKTLISN